ncbi:MAG: SUMF1/EgtB/PvdO family nonheme iron enzyme [Chromatiaceae bacterium]|jgi:iron(II)-dependent oxidoreductase|nr:SUMF1/EgtB/PvdO family nonheme iron enzyme [Chromatiaceae bacterium]
MSESLPAQVRDARDRTLQLIAGLDHWQMMGPRMDIVNPLRWEIGHTAYFYEYWILRKHLGEAPVMPGADSLYDSITIAHATRWDLPLPDLPATLAYMQEVQASVCRHLEQDPPDPQRDYLTQYAVFHEDMHTEAFTYTRQTLGYPAPAFGAPAPNPAGGGLAGDARIPGGRFLLGATPHSGFVFDNEKWGHVREVEPFQIARAAVSNSEFAAFVDAGGYHERAHWDDAGWGWRLSQGLEHPVYWRPRGDGWEQRHFDTWQPLRPHAAVIHVSWHEAQAYCRWAGRRLPSELEWEVAAAAQPTPDGSGLTATKRRYPWGDAEPTPALASLDGDSLGTIDVGALPAGDSAFGCRQMLGNAWEWTESVFAPYPQFTPDMYSDYSQPLFGTTRVLRGGAWSTRARLIRNTWRNYYAPHRNDVFAGFRTCAL